jgi:hypothetical protein
MSGFRLDGGSRPAIRMISVSVLRDQQNGPFERHGGSIELRIVSAPDIASVWTVRGSAMMRADLDTVWLLEHLTDDTIAGMKVIEWQ